MSKERSLGEQNYADFAARYAERAPTKPHNAHYDRPATLSLVPDTLSGQHVLDAGCGPGLYAEVLLERGATVTGIDVTEGMLDAARERLGERATLLRADLEQPLPFDDARFDGVLCALVLDYIEDWTRLFHDLHRVLVPGGWLVLSAGHPASDYQHWERAAGDAARYFDTQRMEMAWGGFGEPRPIIRSWRRPLQAFINPLCDAGLRIERVLEPLPAEDYARADPAGYAALLRAPQFMMVRARKTC